MAKIITCEEMLFRLPPERYYIFMNNWSVPHEEIKSNKLTGGDTPGKDHR